MLRREFNLFSVGSMFFKISSLECGKLLMFVVVALSILAGCSGDKLPKINEPKVAAEMAMNAFDKNQDGKIAGDELEECLALKSALDRIDTNEDSAIDVGEIVYRFEAYSGMSKYIISEVEVLADRKPVSGAEISLEPESFLGEGLPRFVGTTSSTGIVLPDSDPPGLLGFPLGFYRVSITTGGAEHSFGVELADDVPGVSRMLFEIQQ